MKAKALLPCFLTLVLLWFASDVSSKPTRNSHDLHHEQYKAERLNRKLNELNSKKESSEEEFRGVEIIPIGKARQKTVRGRRSHVVSPKIDVFDSRSNGKMAAKSKPEFQRKFELEPGDDYVPVNKRTKDSIKLNCAVQDFDSTRMNLTWFKDEKKIITKFDREGESANYEFRKKRQYLHIHESHLLDNGMYKCIVTNRIGTVERKFKIHVEPKTVGLEPKVERGFPGNHTVLIGTNLTLKCPLDYVEPADPPSIMWIKHDPLKEEEAFELFSEDGKPLYRSLQNCAATNQCTQGENGTNYFVENYMEMTLYNLTLNDTRWYSCVVGVHYSNTISSGFVNVVEKLPVSPSEIRANIIIVGAVVVVCFFLAIVVAVGIYAKKQRKKRKKTNEYARSVVLWTKRIMVTTEGMCDNSGQYSGSARCVVPQVTLTRERAVLGSDSTYVEYEYPSDPKWEIERSKVSLQEKLGEGAFGRVMKARVIIGNYTRIVAVKMLKEGHTDSDVIDLVKEMTIMKSIGRHDNIINLLGVCTKPPGALYVLVEYAKFGNLKEFLFERRLARPCHSCRMVAQQQENAYLTPTISNNYATMIASGDEAQRLTKCPQSCVLNLEDLLKIGWQVAKGMEFLYHARCIHRDLAARNVLVCEDNLVKIADFGMARDIQNDEYYRKNSEGRLPVKWMPPEAVFERLYTSQSDVWSYGIFLWEVMTFGESPFKDVSIDVFFEYLRVGKHLPMPANCPNEVYYDVMKECWRMAPSERPSWPRIVDTMHNLCATALPDKYTLLLQPVQV